MEDIAAAAAIRIHNKVNSNEESNDTRILRWRCRQNWHGFYRLAANNFFTPFSLFYVRAVALFSTCLYLSISVRKLQTIRYAHNSCCHQQIFTWIESNLMAMLITFTKVQTSCLVCVPNIKVEEKIKRHRKFCSNLLLFFLEYHVSLCVSLSFLLECNIDFLDMGQIIAYQMQALYRVRK